MEFLDTTLINSKTLEHSLKKKEVALFLLGTFAEDVIVYYSKNQDCFDFNKFIDFLIKESTECNCLFTN